MIGTISTGILIAIIAIGAIGFLIGYSKGTFRSLLDLGFLVLNIILSVWISTLIAKSIVDVELIAEKLPTISQTLGLSEELTNQIHTYLTMPELATTAISLAVSLVAVITMPIIFMVVFMALGLILLIPKIILQKVIFSKPKGIGLKLGGGAIGVVTKIVSTAVILVPIIGYLNFANDSIKLLNEDEKIVNLGAVENVLDEAADSVASRAIYSFGGEALFNNLTTATVDGIKISLSNETESAIKLYKETGSFKGTSASEYGEEQIESIERIEKIINESNFLPALIANSLSFVATEWTNDRPVFGYEKPEVGEQLQGAFDSTLKVLAETNMDSFKADVCTVAEILKHSIEDGIIQEASKEGGSVLTVLENTDVISDILLELHKNERTRPILPAITNGVINYLYGIYDEVNGTTTEKHEAIDSSTLTEVEVINEGKIISDVIVEIDAFMKSIDGKLDSGEMMDILKYGDFAALGRGFNGIKQSYLFGETFEFVLKMVLESKGCSQLGILDDKFIDNAIKHDSDMEMMLIARQKITLMVMSMHNGDELDYNTTIEALISNVTSGDADSIKSIITEENLNSIGIAGESAHTISGLLTSMVNSIQKDDLVIPEENVAKEAESAGKVLNAVNSALENSEKDKNVFASSNDDTLESTSNMTATEFVSTTMESELVASMVIEATKDSEGNEVDDPYNVKEHLSENDISELESALAEEYSKADENDEATKQKLDAIAHIFGIDTTKLPK